MNRIRIEIGFLSFIFVTSVTSFLFNYNFPVFAAACVLIFLYIVISGKSIALKNNNNILILPFIAISVFFAAWLIIELRFFGMVKQEFFNFISVCLFMFSFLAIIKRKIHFNYFLNISENIFLVVTFLVSIIGLYKFLLFALFRQTIAYFNYLGFSMNSALISDYNFFSLGMICGLILTYRLFKKVENLKLVGFLYFSIFTHILCILSSGSRRGIFIVILLCLYVIVSSLFKRKTKELTQDQKRKKNLTKILTTSTLILLSIVSLYLYEQFINSPARYVIEKLFDRFLTAKNLSAASDIHANRLIYWILSKEYFFDLNIFQKLFGSGFSYLDYLGRRLGVVEIYPHNMMIANLLSTGLIGSAFFILSLIVSFFMYLTYYKALNAYLVFFIITLFFNQFSGDSVFYNKFFVLLILLPILYNNVISAKEIVVNKDNSSLKTNNETKLTQE